MKKLEFNPLRVFQAISRIGYSADSAIMDIVDNSITAQAKNIKIVLVVDENKTLRNANNVEEIIIIDDGKGMNESGIENALTLGSSNNYPPDSLSKYGMGLKSAGFSLGKKITVTSKQADSELTSWYLDIDKLNEGYNIYLTPEVDIYLDKVSHINEHGTIIHINNCKGFTKDSADLITRNLQEKLGVTYYPILKKAEASINLIVQRGNTEKQYSIEPFDILFMKDCIANEFHYDTYDCLHPVKVFDSEISLTNETDRKMKLEITVFPQDRMKSYINFNEEERKKVESYLITAKNKGFFIYRNNRLIRWGDDLGGDGIKAIVGRNQLGFRARLFIYTQHDELFNVDVSKQRMNIPENVLDDIKMIVRNHLDYADQAFEKCRLLCDKSTVKEEGISFSERNVDLAPEDPDEEVSRPNPENTIDKTTSKQRKISYNTILDPNTSNSDTESSVSEPIKEVDTPNDNQESEAEVEFKMVRYSNNIGNERFLTTGYNADYGVYVTINQNHHYYSNVLSRLSSQDNIKQTIEAVIWAMGVAEHMTYANLTSVDEKILKQVLAKYNKVFTNNLSNWSNSNNDILDE